MKQQTSSSKLFRIRRQHRNKQLEQLLKASRFSNIGIQASYLKKTEQSYAFLTQPALLEILRQGDLSKLYRVVVEVGFEGEEIIQNHFIDILRFLQGRLHFPQSALTLANLINRYQLLSYLAYSQKIIAKIINQMSNMHPSSQGQIIYEWVLCAATQRPQKVQIQQMKPFYPILQQILRYAYIGDQKVNYILIQLVKNLSELQIALSYDTIIFFTQYFWKIHDQAALVNIYLTCVNLLKKIMLYRSTKVVIHLLVIYLKGRSKFSIKLGSFAPQTYNMMQIVLKDCNLIFQHMHQQQIQIQKAVVKTTLHSFLLEYEYSLFIKSYQSQKDSQFLQYLLFLQEFCIFSPIQLTLRRLFQLGTIQNIASNLTISPQICEKGLKILWSFAQRAKSSIDYKLMGVIKQKCGIQFQLNQVLLNFSNMKVAEYAKEVLQVYSKI